MDTFISFSPISTAVNAGVGIGGYIAFIFTRALITPTSRTWSSGNSFGVESCHAYSPNDLIGPSVSILGIILTLVAAFFNQCCCCKCSCCCEPFQFGALVTSSLHTPYILRPDGQLVREGETDIEENKEELVVVLEMEESQNIVDLVPLSGSASDILVTEAELEADEVIKEEIEAD